MRAITANLSLADRIEVRVDLDAEPVDVDQAVARFLLAFVRQQAASNADASAEPAAVAPTAAGPSSP